MRDLNNISSIMIKDHLRILSLLHVFEQTDKDNINAKLSSFETLNCNLEKHISTEEKVVFNSFNTKEKKEHYSLFMELSKQHTGILNELVIIKKQLNKRILVEGFNLREKLINHQKYEEQLLYPRLDKELTEDEKYFILDRIREII